MTAEKLRPYYEDTLVTLYHGDVMDVLPTLNEQVDLVVTDPPYFQPATHYVPPRAAAKPIRSLGDTSVLRHAFDSWARELDRLVVEGGSLYVFCDGQSYPIVFNSFYSLGRVRPLIWDKVVSFNGYTWRHQHELIGWVERTTAERLPTGDGDILRARAVPLKDRLHPAEKPSALIARLIEKHAPQLVLDPFAGSGSTLVAAKAQGCHAIGIEIEERYCEVAASRIGNEQVLSLAV